jgi:hypothetical protein
MPERAKRPGRWPASAPAVMLVLLLAGCNSGRQPLVYQDEQGFHFTPPPGWVERARPTGPAPAPHGRARPNLPLPPLDVAGERLLARYDRLTAGHQAWLRLSVADVPPSLSLEKCLSVRVPGADWRRESNVEALEVSGLPAARVTFRGHWDGQDYVNETVAVRKEGRVYFVTASYPASDATARDQVRQAVAGASWR